MVRNGHLPEREIFTGIGSVKVQGLKVRDRSGSGTKFNKELLPSYLRETKRVELLIPWLYLKGFFTGDFDEALRAMFGTQAAGLSPSTVSRLKSAWESEYESLRRHELSTREIVYRSADGVYTGFCRYKA